jgi:hypothetical protein
VYAPPTTFTIDRRQHVVIASGSTLTAFALPPEVTTTGPGRP